MTEASNASASAGLSARRFSMDVVATPSPTFGIRRTSSNLTEFSLDEAKKTLRSSTDNIFLPTAAMMQDGLEPSHWHSAPLAFALLPALGGLLFKNGSSVITDITLLGLAAVFLNWSVRLPWHWYQSAQSIRSGKEYDHEAVVDSETDDDNHSNSNLDVSQASLGDIAEEEQSPTPKSILKRKSKRNEAASNELHAYEIIALLSCFIAPLMGSYLLHTIRSQLTRPSEGLVSNYNLTIFLLAAELRPLSHLVKLIQSRTLHLQRVVHSNPYTKDPSSTTLTDLTSRIINLESKDHELFNGAGTGGALPTKQVTAITTSIRQHIQPDLDALTRAVRRYEKRATLQTMQTEARLADLEARLNDAISLAAAAAHGNMRPGFAATLMEWVGMGLVLPFQGLASLAALPVQTLVAMVGWGKRVVVVGGGRGSSLGDGKGRRAVSGVLRHPGYRGTTRSLKKA